MFDTRIGRADVSVMLDPENLSNVSSIADARNRSIGALIPIIASIAAVSARRQYSGFIGE